MALLTAHRIRIYIFTILLGASLLIGVNILLPRSSTWIVDCSPDTIDCGFGVNTDLANLKSYGYPLAFKNSKVHPADELNGTPERTQVNYSVSHLAVDTVFWCAVAGVIVTVGRTLRKYAHHRH